MNIKEREELVKEMQSIREKLRKSRKTEEIIENIRKKIRKAREKSDEAKQAYSEALDALEAAGIDTNVPSSAPYTANLTDAIFGYVEENEDTLKYIMADIREEFERGREA